MLVAVAAALVAAAPGHAGPFPPTAAWLAVARCVHLREGAWRANTGNGYFGGMQFSRATWLAAGGGPVAALAHPGDAAFPFSGLERTQLRVAYGVWRRDGGSWRSWGDMKESAPAMHFASQGSCRSRAFGATRQNTGKYCSYPARFTSTRTVRFHRRCRQ